MSSPENQSFKKSEQETARGISEIEKIFEKISGVLLKSGDKEKNSVEKTSFGATIITYKNSTSFPNNINSLNVRYFLEAIKEGMRNLEKDPKKIQ